MLVDNSIGGRRDFGMRKGFQFIVNKHMNDMGDVVKAATKRHDGIWKGDGG